MQFLAYILVYPLLWCVSILPFRLLYGLSDVIFVVVYHLIGYRKKEVRDNLELVFPNKTDQEIRAIMKPFYHHLCDLMMETIKSMTISEKQMKEHFTFSNIEEIKKLEAENRSIALMCAHYGSWEWIFILQKYVKHTGYGIYKPLSNKYFDRLVKRIRARYNTFLISTKETIPTLAESKQKGELSLSGFASDQSPQLRKAYYWREFMGINVPVHTGAEMIAKKLDLAVVFFKVKRLKRGYYETTFETLTTRPRDHKDYDITDMFFERVEKQIREKPEYYLWTHKRWKHRGKEPKVRDK